MPFTWEEQGRGFKELCWQNQHPGQELGVLPHRSTYAFVKDVLSLSFQPAGISCSSIVYGTAICCLGNKCWCIPNRAYSFTEQSSKRSRWLPHLFCCVSHYPHPQLDDRNLWFSASICGPAASTHVSWGAMFLLGYDMLLCLASLFWLPANGTWPKSKKNPTYLLTSVVSLIRGTKKAKYLLQFLFSGAL